MTSIHAAMTEIQTAKKVRTDGQMAFQLYIVDSDFRKLNWSTTRYITVMTLILYCLTTASRSDLECHAVK